MCGIVAVFSSASASQAGAVASALEVLRHRGPDGIASAASGRGLLGHVRLAIVDVQGGHQPMRGEDARFTLVCNGEIYNHQQLREGLVPRHLLASLSDSEVVLHLYEDRGEACVHELDGMFAFVVTDGERFTAARDAFGIKPLYVGWNSATRELWFASEFKALMPRCQGFKALPPGSYLTQDGEVERWFAPHWAREVGRRALGSSDELRHQLKAAVVKRLMSDVPIGVFLSGGLDSSIVAALASEQLGPIETFAVGLAGSSDLEAARCVAQALGTRHRECVYTARDVAAVLETVIYHLESYDPALIRSAVPCYLLARLAAQTVKVVLTGEGADELFGGYAYFDGLEDPEHFHRECVSLLLNLHSMNLQRVDRMTMAHGLEGRVPFLDAGFVAWSMGLDPRLKLWGAGTLEKGLLREAFRSVLPPEIVARRKVEFSAGSGIDALLADQAERRVSDRDLARAGARFTVDPPATKEEVLYRRMFEEFFPGTWPQANVQRWRPSARLAASKTPSLEPRDEGGKEHWS
jgi:asparagine synthase (glutamine-hydrolysing)